MAKHAFTPCFGTQRSVTTELDSQTNQWRQTPPIFFTQWDLPCGHLSVTWKRRHMACWIGVRKRDSTPVCIARLKSYFGETLCRGIISHNCPTPRVLYTSFQTPTCGDTLNDFCNYLVCQRCLQQVNLKLAVVIFSLTVLLPGVNLDWLSG